MITKYRTRSTIPEIDMIEVDRETNASVWINGVRRQKDSGYERFHDSWEEAHKSLIEKASRRIETVEMELVRYKQALSSNRRTLDLIREMKKP